MGLVYLKNSMCCKMSNGRCRMRGGKSTGRPKIHGLYSKEAKAQKLEWKNKFKWLKELLDQVG